MPPRKYAQFRTVDPETRQPSERAIGKVVHYTDAEGRQYEIGEADGKLEVRALEGYLVLEPRASNVVLIHATMDA